MNVIDLTLLVLFDANIKHYHPTAAQRRNRRSKLVTFLILKEIYRPRFHISGYISRARPKNAVAMLMLTLY